MKVSFLVGRLTRDPVASSGGEYPRALATIACTALGYGAARETEYVDLVVDGKLAAVVLEHGHEGDLIAVVGNEALKHFQRRNGEKATMNEVYVTSFDFLGQQQGARRDPARRPATNGAAAAAPGPLREGGRRGR